MYKNSENKSDNMCNELDKNKEIIYTNKYDNNIITSEKFNSTTWGLIEKVPDADEIKRLNVLKELGDSTCKEEHLDESKLYTIGSNFYHEVRKVLKGKLILPKSDFIQEDSIKKNKLTKTKKNNSNLDKEESEKLNQEENTKNNCKKLKNETSKGKKLIEDNVKDTIIRKLDSLIEIMNDKPNNKIYNDIINMHDTIEFRIILLMKIIEISSTRLTESSYKEELLIESKKIIYFLKNIYSKENNDLKYHYFKRILKNDDIRLPTQLILDFESKISTLETFCNFKLYNIANNRPKFIYHTRFSDTIPDVVIKAYDSQIELMNKIKSNLTNGFNIYLKTLPGLGKTTMIVAICQYLKQSKSKLRVIFCCSDLLKSVRIQVLKIIFYCKIKFAIATALPNSENFKLTRSNNCSSENEIELIVADYKSTYLLLKKHEVDMKDKMKKFNQLKKLEQKALLEQKNKYLLFFDEPTVLTDRIENKLTLEYLSRILFYIPSHCIFSSATLPVMEELDIINQHYISKYPEGFIDEVISNKTLLGCFIKDFNSQVIVPHSSCKNVDDLKLILKGIKTFPLLGKFYTLPFLINLNEFLKTYNKNIDLDAIESFDHDNILENIMKLLEKVTTLDENEFDLFKKIEVKDIIEDTLNLEKLDEYEIDFNKVEHENLILAQAYKFLGCCLVATEDPLEYVRTYFYNTVKKIMSKLNIRDMKKYYEAYKKLKKKYDEEVEDIQEKFKCDYKIDERVEALTKPEFLFPKKYEVNTAEHIKIFAKYVKHYDPSLLKSYINQENIDVSKFDIDDELRTLLYMGIGIYTNGIDNEYKEKVLELLNEGKIAFLITDESFFYGANYKITNVIINDDIADLHSINAILQLIGRTSRVGKSWAGKVYLDTNTKNRILKFFSNPVFTSDEAINITSFFNSIKDSIAQEEINEKLKSEEDERNKIEAAEKAALDKQIKLEMQKKLEEELRATELNEQMEKWGGIRRKRKDQSNLINQEKPQLDNTNLITLENNLEPQERNLVWSSINRRKSSDIVNNKNETNYDNENNYTAHKDYSYDNVQDNTKWSSIRRKKSDDVNNNQNKNEIIIDKTNENIDINIDININNNSNSNKWSSIRRKKNTDSIIEIDKPILKNEIENKNLISAKKLKSDIPNDPNSYFNVKKDNKEKIFEKTISFSGLNRKKIQTI